ncbi:hypothetical protein CL3_31160 [butyrate-producing bacterium SM4/1]|nr:hypothetical protein CL3_31160 [butyrate-producing bacterium SM4/1]
MRLRLFLFCRYLFSAVPASEKRLRIQQRLHPPQERRAVYRSESQLL